MVERCCEIVCDHYGVELEHLRDIGLRSVWTWPRNVAMWLCIECGANVHYVAFYLNRHRSDVTKMAKRVNELRGVYPRVGKRLDELKRKAMQ